MNALHPSLVDQLRCPACKGVLAKGADALACTSCRAAFPVVRGVPILIDEQKSLFRIADCAATAPAEVEAPPSLKERVRAALDRMVPKTGKNLAGEDNLATLAAGLREEGPSARVLVLGGGTLGVGMRAIADQPGFTLAEADVAFGPRTSMICDAHEIPFADGTFDAVIAQAVLEYVIDPFHVAAEIHRVLRPRGWVYAESPFMQQVHGGAYDFFRFTHLGHRRLFRMFSEEKSGVVCGPAMAFAWSYRYFLRSFARGRVGRVATDFIGNLTSRWMVRLDPGLAEQPGAYDAASAFYFLGRRAETPVPDAEILASYRGTWKIRR